MRILDLGCGRGEETTRLKKTFGENSKVFGIDIQRKNIDFAKKKFTDCKFMLAKGEKIPFENNFFDLIYSIEVLEHVNNLKKTIKEVSRTLKKGGKFIITFPNAASEKELVKFNKNYLKQIGHKRIINLDEFKHLSEKFFRIKSIKIYNSIEHLYWINLFKKNYQIISENGDLDKPAPGVLTLFTELFNPDRKDEKTGITHKITRFFNCIFSRVYFILDLFFIKKRIKIILIKK